MTAKEHFDAFLSDGKIEPLKLDDGQPLIIDGVPYYGFSNNGDKYPQSRILMMQDLIDENSRFGLDGKTLDRYHELMEQSMTEGLLCVKSEPAEAIREITTALQTLKAIRSYRTTGLNLESTIQVSAIWFLRENEDPGFQEEGIFRQKVAAFSSKPEYVDFFLRTGNSLVNPSVSPYKDSFRNAIPQMLEAVQMEMDLLRTTAPNSGESDETRSAQADFWRLRQETLKNLKDYLDSQPTNSTS